MNATTGIRTVLMRHLCEMRMEDFIELIFFCNGNYFFLQYIDNMGNFER